jgi:hypothetical protein
MLFRTCEQAFVHEASREARIFRELVINGRQLSRQTLSSLVSLSNISTTDVVMEACLKMSLSKTRTNYSDIVPELYGQFSHEYHYMPIQSLS